MSVNFVANPSKNVYHVRPLVEVFYGPQLKQKVASLERSPTFSTFGWNPQHFCYYLAPHYINATHLLGHRLNHGTKECIYFPFSSRYTKVPNNAIAKAPKWFFSHFSFEQETSPFKYLWTILTTKAFIQKVQRDPFIVQACQCKNFPDYMWGAIMILRW